MLNLEKALLNPRFYDCKTTAVKFKKTWLNFLFFTDKFIYKIKQPISRFNKTIDYTTLAGRKRDTSAEYKINKFFSPSVYAGVVPVRIDACGNVGTNVKGKIIDYALKIKRLPEKREMSELIRLKKIKKRDVFILAKTLRTIHQKLSDDRKPAQCPDFSFFRRRWSEIFERASRPNIKKIIGARFLRRLGLWYDNFFFLFEAPLVARRFFSQRIHGDLSIENIFYVNDKFYFLDAISLDDWGYGDPLNDVGAIAKDFDAYYQNKLGSFFIFSYLKNDDDAPRIVIWLYKIYWAANKYLLYIDILARTPQSRWGKINIEQAGLYRNLLERYLAVPPDLTRLLKK